MNKYTFLKDCLIFTVGGGFGCIVGVSLTTAKYEELIKKYEDFINVELKKIEEKKYNYSAAKEKEPSVDNSIGLEYDIPDKIDYTKFYKSEETEDPADREFPKEEDEEVEPFGGRKKITKVIKDDDYGKINTYNQRHLLYYTETDTLTITEGVGIEDIIRFDEVEGMIGDALTKFGFKTNDQLKICVRNYKDGCDYEIIKVFGPYEDD